MSITKEMKKVHVAKFTKEAVGHMLQHYERAKNKNGEYVTHNHQDINKDKTKYNYSVGGDYGKEIDKLEFLLSQDDVKCMNRKNVNVMCDVVLTAPKDLPESEYKKFFEVGYNFLCSRYGVKDEYGKYRNVISSYVHMDEKQPHLHFAFVPLVWTEKKYKNGVKKEFYKVSAKQVIDKQDLLTLHKDATEYFKSAFGRDIGLENGITKAQGDNKTVEQLKYATKLDKRVKQAEKALKTQNEELVSKRVSNYLCDDLIALQSNFEQANEDLKCFKPVKNGYILSDYQDFNLLNNRYRVVIYKKNKKVFCYENQQEFKSDKNRIYHDNAIFEVIQDVINAFKELVKSITGHSFDKIKEITNSEKEKDITEDD